MADLNWHQRFIKGMLHNIEDGSADRYRILHRNIIALMILVTILPLTLMAVINHHQYHFSHRLIIQTSLKHAMMFTSINDVPINI